MWLRTTGTRLGRGFFGIAGKRVGFARKRVGFRNAMKWAGERLVGRVRGNDKGQGLVDEYRDINRKFNCSDLILR